MRLFYAVAALACGLLYASAEAASLQGGLINHVIDDKAFYAKGGNVSVGVGLSNQTGSAFTGTISLAVCSRGQVVGLAAQTHTLAAGAVDVAQFSFTLPDLNVKAFQLSIAALNSGDSGAAECTGTGTSSTSPVDVASGAINIAANAQEDPIEAFVDPQAMQSVTDYGTIADNLAQYHVNLIQFYDWGYRHDEPYTSAANWLNLESVPVTKAETQGLILAFWKYGMFAQLYTSWNGAYDDWPTKNPNITIGMGAFKDQCGLTGACTVSDQFLTAGGWLAWGWQVDGSVQQNPSNGRWRDWIASQYQAAMQGWGFNGVHLDTMGDPGVPLYDAKGRPLDNLGSYLTDFANYIQDYTGACTDINQVSGWNLQDEAVRGRSCNLYIEPHPEFGNYPYYPSVNGLVEQMREWTNRPLITAYYPQRVMSGDLDTSYAVNGDAVVVCNPNHQVGCYANNPGIKLLLGQVAVSGASQLMLGDYDHLTPGPFFPGATLIIDSNLQQYLADYYNWFVGARDILRAHTVDSTDVAHVADSSGVDIGSSSGAAGKVYYRALTRAGVAGGVSLTNLIGLSDNRIDDPDGLHKPAMQNNITVIMQVYGSSPTGNLYFSAPDYNHGFPQKLSYSVGSSGTNNGLTVYNITFTVPSLATVGVAWLEENNLKTADDWTLDATSQDFIRGGTPTWSPNGMGASAAATVHGCCGRGIYWDNIDFGSGGLTTLSAVTHSTAGAPIEFHLDSMNGPMLAAVSAPASSGSNVDTESVKLITVPSGIHRVWVKFPYQDVSLFGWRP